MPSIRDHIDRFSATAEAVNTSASAIAQHDPSPFTRSVLATPLGDLIRDIDPSELGLFSLVPSQQQQQPVNNTQAEALTRVEVVSATPLRKHPSAQRRGQPNEPEPEVFAEAALKYIDRYSGVRSMPRVRSQVEAMLERLRQLREEIQSLNSSLKDTEASQSMSGSLSPKSLIAEEERRIQDTQTRIGQLRKQKVALQSNRSVAVAQDDDNLACSLGPSSADPQEDSFWTTPGAKRTLQFKNELLVDEDVDLEDVTSSFSTPVVPFKSSASRSVTTDLPVQEEESPTEDTVPEDSSILEDTFDRTVGAHDSNLQNIGQVVDHTTNVKHRPTQPSPRSVPPPTSEPSTPVVNVKRLSSISTTESLGPTHSAKKIRVTNDVERIVSKIWATVGDLIMPGNSFSTSGSGGSRPLRAKETIAHLHTLAAQDPLPASPAASSLSSATVASAQSPTSQQVLTAHLLIALLEATPQYALSLAKVKEILSARGERGMTTIGGGSSIRVLYGCVAKRLVRIDRGGGEQIVRFDI